MRKMIETTRELQLKPAGTLTLDSTKTVRLHGVKSDGTKIYLGRHEGFATIEAELEDGHIEHEHIVEVK
jgi:hypothetical protein